MGTSRRTAADILEECAAGKRALRDVVGLSSDELEPFRAAARGAIERKDFSLAVQILKGLSALEPNTVEYPWLLAIACDELGDSAAALAALERYLSIETYLPRSELAAILGLKAKLLKDVGPHGAEGTLQLLQQLE